ncbi:hypothetical protein [Desulfovibrio cuneatus]|uniref:CdiA C-terminal domain-containing protein n=1 Tax=Desulfovibrio cuneatus TaxID=159728 RepID=UPI00146FB17C
MDCRGKKINEGQTNNVVINLSDTNVTIDALRQQFTSWPMDGLKRALIIDKQGNITPLF